MSFPNDPQPGRAGTSESALDQETVELLHSANHAYQQGLKEPRAWLALNERRRKHRRFYFHVSLAALTAAVLVWTVSQYDSGQAVSERTPLKPEPPAAPVPVAPVPEAQPAAEALAPDPPSEPPAPAMRAQAAQRRPAAAPTEAECRAWLSKRKYAQAASCFEQLAAEGGIEADVAQLEQARIAIQHLGSPARGLRVLERDWQRLKASPLRGEAAELRVLALYALKRDQQALAASEAVLSAPWGRDAAPRMRWIRGNIYEERLGDCARAAEEYLALLGQSGPQGDKAEFRRARCLETLGRRSEARAAFERYLRRDSPASADAAQASLRRLAQAEPDDQ